MQNAALPPTTPFPAPLPFFAWAIPPECQWWDIAGRDPCQPLARKLFQVLAGRDRGARRR